MVKDNNILNAESNLGLKGEYTNEDVISSYNINKEKLQSDRDTLLEYLKLNFDEKVSELRKTHLGSNQEFTSINNKDKEILDLANKQIESYINGIIQNNNMSLALANNRIKVELDCIAIKMCSKYNLDLNIVFGPGHLFNGVNVEGQFKSFDCSCYELYDFIISIYEKKKSLEKESKEKAQESKVNPNVLSIVDSLNKYSDGCEKYPELEKYVNEIKSIIEECKQKVKTLDMQAAIDVCVDYTLEIESFISKVFVNEICESLGLNYEILNHFSTVEGQSIFASFGLKMTYEKILFLSRVKRLKSKVGVISTNVKNNAIKLFKGIKK